MNIEVLGSGCAKCLKLHDTAVAAACELGLDAHVEKVADMARIASYGVMRTPALVVDGKVVLMGMVPGKEQLKAILQARSGR